MGIRIVLKRLSPAERSTVKFGLPDHVGLWRIVLSAGLHGAEILECLLLLLHAIRRCTCWCANPEGVLTVREANSSSLYETIQCISLQLMKRLGCMAYVLKLYWNLDM